MPANNVIHAEEYFEEEELKDFKVLFTRTQDCEVTVKAKNKDDAWCMVEDELFDPENNNFVPSNRIVDDSFEIGFENNSVDSVEEN